jgi:hypothetical protein
MAFYIKTQLLDIEVWDIYTKAPVIYSKNLIIITTKCPKLLKPATFQRILNNGYNF